MKYALIGCGRIAVNHMKAAINNKLEIVAVCDVLPEKMEALLAKYDLQNDTSIKRYTDYKQMLAENDITLASIATESGIHAEIALYCIDHGVNVIIEKPMAMNMDDAEEIVRRSEEKGVKVAACHQNRFNVAIQQMRKALESGRFGKISHGSIHVRWNRDHSYYDQASWRGTWAQDGGCLMNRHEAAVPRLSGVRGHRHGRGEVQERCRGHHRGHHQCLPQEPGGDSLPLRRDRHREDRRHLHQQHRCVELCR